MKVQNMISNSGNRIANQFVIHDNSKRIFQSYDSIIAVKESDGTVKLDERYWDYSTTGKYRNQFLDETKRETESKINEGVYILTDLN